MLWRVVIFAALWNSVALWDFAVALWNSVDALWDSFVAALGSVLALWELNVVAFGSRQMAQLC